jgi:hypothetical protein
MQAEAEAPAVVPEQGGLSGIRMLFVAPDDYPAFRVDLVELFSNHLVSRGLNIDWSLLTSAAPSGSMSRVARCRKDSVRCATGWRRTGFA